MDTRDILIVRQTCIKAAAEVRAGQPVLTSEATTPEQLAVDTVFLAQQFEEWCLRPEGFGESLGALERASSSGPEPPQRASGNGKGTAAAQPQAQKQTGEVVGGFDFNECPFHPEKTAPSKFGNFFCQEKSCDWEQKDFTNTDDDTGKKYVVTKVKFEGKWFTEDRFVEVLREQGALA